MAMDLNAKAAYIRGLMTGMDFDADSKNGKVIAAMMDLLEEMAAQVVEHDNALDQVYDELETLDQDVDDIVSDLYADDDEDDEPIKVRPMPRSASADPVDDFADIFGISTKAAEQPAEAQPLKPEESKLPPMHDAFWDDFGPAQRTAAPKPAEKAPEAKPKSAADAGEDFSIEDILAEFKDL